MYTRTMLALGQPVAEEDFVRLQDAKRICRLVVMYTVSNLEPATSTIRLAT